LIFPKFGVLSLSRKGLIWTRKKISEYYSSNCDTNRRLPNKFAFAIFVVGARYILIYLYKLNYDIFEWIIKVRAT